MAKFVKNSFSVKSGQNVQWLSKLEQIKETQKMLAILQDQIPSLHVWAMLDQGKKVNYPTVLTELKTNMHKMKLQNTLNGVPVSK
jgi:hypothetical protein